MHHDTQKPLVEITTHNQNDRMQDNESSLRDQKSLQMSQLVKHTRDVEQVHPTQKVMSTAAIELKSRLDSLVKELKERTNENGCKLDSANQYIDGSSHSHGDQKVINNSRLNVKSASSKKTRPLSARTFSTRTPTRTFRKDATLWEKRFEATDFGSGMEGLLTLNDAERLGLVTVEDFEEKETQFLNLAQPTFHTFHTAEKERVSCCQDNCKDQVVSPVHSESRLDSSDSQSITTLSLATCDTPDAISNFVPTKAKIPPFLHHSSTTNYSLTPQRPQSAYSRHNKPSPRAKSHHKQTPRQRRMTISDKSSPQMAFCLKNKTFSQTAPSTPHGTRQRNIGNMKLPLSISQKTRHRINSAHIEKAQKIDKMRPSAPTPHATVEEKSREYISWVE